MEQDGASTAKGQGGKVIPDMVPWTITKLLATGANSRVPVGTVGAPDKSSQRALMGWIFIAVVLLVLAPYYTVFGGIALASVLAWTEAAPSTATAAGLWFLFVGYCWAAVKWLLRLQTRTSEKTSLDQELREIRERMAIEEAEKLEAVQEWMEAHRGAMAEFEAMGKEFADFINADASRAALLGAIQLDGDQRPIETVLWTDTLRLMRTLASTVGELHPAIANAYHVVHSIVSARSFSYEDDILLLEPEAEEEPTFEVPQLIQVLQAYDVQSGTDFSPVLSSLFLRLAKVSLSYCELDLTEEQRVSSMFEDAYPRVHRTTKPRSFLHNYVRT
jgi:hypothetical protein